MQRRWIKWIVAGSVSLVMLLTLLIAPAQAGRAVKATFHALPDPLTDLVPDSAERSLGETVDSVSKFFAFGNPHELIQLQMRLRSSSVAPGGWTSGHGLALAWTDLGPKVEYEVSAAHSGDLASLQVALGRFRSPNATLELPGDGDWFVRVRPFAGSDGGHTTTFGPFRVDSTPPPAPVLDPVPPPPGYTFTVQWQPVSDASGIAGYQVERLGTGALFQAIGQTALQMFTEDQLGNGHYSYRIRAINGAGSVGLPSNVQEVTVKAPMKNPGVGKYQYGVFANYTTFLKLWDISDPNKYARIEDVPQPIRDQYLGAGWGIDINNQTLIQRAREIVGSERNTLTLASKLFEWLFDYADYDSEKLNASQTPQQVFSAGETPASCKGHEDGLQPAGCTYDRRKGICGDLATLYITMLRIAGVPARPVHGYLDNPSEQIGDFHVWVEVWVGASVKAADKSDTRDDWMTVDVSGITGPFDASKFLIYFGIYNPEYLALGLEADYEDSAWNSWAQFGWTKKQSSAGQPDFLASGHPTELDSKVMDLYFNTLTKKRVLVEADRPPPSSEYRSYYEDVKVVSKKRIDYGVNMAGATPINATIRVRYPVADAFANVTPWQSVIYTIYTNAGTVNKEPGKSYSRLEPYGFVVWEDDFK